jgi:hypothetical protein
MKFMFEGHTTAGPRKHSDFTQTIHKCFSSVQKYHFRITERFLSACRNYEFHVSFSSLWW